MITSFVVLLWMVLQVAPPQTAALQGRVVTADETPLARATVELRHVAAGNAALVASTNEEGLFTFANLAPGQYRMMTVRNGYVPAEYGQRAPGGPGLPITLAGGQQRRDLRIVLTPSASISGRILLRTGKPVVNAEVMAMKASFQEGRRALTLVQSARTNDLGEYRLYWLTPGSYYISSLPWDERPISGGVVMNPDAPRAPVDIARMTVLAGDTARAPLGFQPSAPPSDVEAWVPIYFPGTAVEESAAEIALTPGASVRGIDVILAPVKPRRIRGSVVDALGQPASNAQIFRSRTSSNSNAFTTEMVDPARGVFEVRGVIPGPYTLLAIAGDRTGKAAVEVGETDVDNVRIVVEAGVSLSGRLTIDGRAGDSEPVSGLRVSLAPDPRVPGLPIPSSPVAAGGAFTLTGILPGSYLATVQPLQPAPVAATAQRGNAIPPAPQLGAPPVPALSPALQNAYVKSIRLGGVDVLNGGLTIAGEPREPLEVVVGQNPGRIDGDVGDVPNATVVLVPAARTRRPDLYKSVLSDHEGRFSFQGLAPGEYLLIAWDQVENGAWMNADFLRTHEGRARVVNVAEGSRQTVPQLPVGR